MSYFRSFTGCSRIIAAMIVLLFAANASAQCYIVEPGALVVNGGTFGPSGLTAGDCLNDAIRDVLPGQTIRLRTDTGPYFIVRAPMAGTPEADERTGLRFIDKEVTIEADDPAATPLDAIISADTTLGAMPDYRLFNVRGQMGLLTLNRVTLENGRSITPGQTNGGAIKHDSLMPLRLTDCIIRNNTAGTRGGGIWSQNICFLENVLFVNNRADPTDVPGNPGESIRGGGLYHAPGKPLGAQVALSMTGCRFHCNTSLEEGGGMWLGGGYQRRVSNCEFYGNAATVSGGAMTANGTTFPSPNPPTLDWLQFDDCRFGAANSVGAACDSPAYRAGNSAGIDGGAVQLVDNAQPIYIRCTFENNRILAGSNGRGGAIYISSVGGNNPNLPRSAVFIESLFLRNQSFNTGQTPAGEGGAVFIRESSSPYFLDCGFVENASRLGGGMHVIGGSNPRMYNCVFSRNSVGGAGPQGSAIWANASSPQLLHCSLLSPIGSPLVWLNSVSATPMQLTGSIVWGNGPGGPNRAFGGNGVVLLDPALTANPQALFSDLDVDVPGRFADQSVDPARTSNINCDPLVANAPINDVHLTNCSPCIDRADHLLASARYTLIFANPLATLQFPFALITGAPQNEQSDFDYDDDFLPPQGAFHNDGSGPRPRNPRLATSGGPVACEADMGADESIRDITDSITLFCDPASDGQPPLEIASADPCSPFGVGMACGPLCEGEQLCLTGVFDGLCPTGVVYQWYFRDDANNDPAFCGPLTTEFVPVVNNGRITGANTPNLCFTDVELCDTGCYRLIITRSTCGGPSRFFCAEDLTTGLATSICGDELTVDVCISVYQAPEIQVHPLPATVCLGGTQNLCATVQVPVGCEPQCIWYRVVGTPDNVNTPGFPFDDVRVCPLQAPLAGITCNDTPLGGGLFACCLTFSPATINHIGDYYVVVTCGGLECSVQSDPAELEVIDPQPLVNNAAVCVGGRQCLEQVAVLPPLTPGSTYTYQWFRRPESDCLTTPCPAGDCSAGTPLTNSGPFSGVNTPVLCIDPASTALRGCYYVVVGIDGLDVDSLPDDGKCVSASNCACLTVIDPFPVVADAAVCLGGTQTLEQTATLPALPAGYTYTFQWFFRGTSNCLTTPCPAGQCGGGTTVSNGGRFSGANTPNLTITNAMAVDAGCYYISVGIDGPEGPAIDAAKCLKSSNCACLSVVNPQPVVNNAAVCLGGTQTLEQVASLPSLPAGYTYTFQWFFRGTSNCITTPCELGDCTGGAPVSNGGRFSGANTPNLTITGAFAADAGCYYVRVGIDGPEGPAIDAAKCIKASNCACLAVVNPLPTVNDAAVCLGGTQALEQTATLPSLPSGYAYTFQWFFRGTSNCITTPCPAGDCTGGTTVPNSGRFSGANTPNLTITGALAADAGCYYVSVGIDGPEGPAIDAGKCLKNSNCACLSIVDPIPLVANAAVCIGGTQTLEQTATLPTLPAGYTYTFQWFFRGTSNCIATPCPAGDCTGGTAVSNSGRFSGANTPSLTISNAMAIDAGCYYVSVGIDGPEGPAIDAAKCLRFSNCACLRVLPQPTFTLHPEPAAVCVGGRQTLTANVTNPGGLSLCLQWYRKTSCSLQGEGVPVVDGSGISGATTNTLTFDPASLDHEGCYYLRARLCEPNDLSKCPWVDSTCACLDVRLPLVPCVLECVSGESDSAGNCLFCPGVDITLCCDVVGAEGPVCYQWQFCADSGPAGCFIDIPSANSACFIIENFNPAIHTGCYRVRINYLDLSGGLGCPDSSDKCDAVYSLPICVAETDRCCPDVCDCKDNADPTQPFYALWKTGEWDGQSGEWSFDRSTTDGIVIKAADDFFLCPSSMHHITRFLGEMLVRQSNPLIEFQAKLFLYEDCDGQPGEQIAEFDSDCPAFVSGAPDGFTRYQVKFDLSEECFWLRGGTYWVSLVAIAPPADASFEAFWAGVGLPGTPPIPTVMGRQPVFMDGDNDWAEYDPCCHPCADLQFCLSGKSCPIMWDNGLPFLGGADSDSPPSPPFQVRGTRSEKSALPVRNSRAADQFIVKTCNPEEVCYLEGYIFTNCIGFEAHLEIYESDCRVPQFELPQASPVFYSAIADPANIIDLGYTGLQVGTTAVRAYKVIFCAFDPGLTFEPGRNYWVSLSVKDSFSANERAFFAHVKTPCDPCTEPYVWKVDPGMELAPGRQIPDWRSAGEDFAFLIATKKQPGTSPIGGPGEGDVCIADANNNNEIDVQDIFVFLSAWFAGCP